MKIRFIGFLRNLSVVHFIALSFCAFIFMALILSAQFTYKKVDEYNSEKNLSKIKEIAGSFMVLTKDAIASDDSERINQGIKSVLDLNLDVEHILVFNEDLERVDYIVGDKLIAQKGGEVVKKCKSNLKTSPDYLLVQDLKYLSATRLWYCAPIYFQNRENKKLGGFAVFTTIKVPFIEDKELTVALSLASFTSKEIKTLYENYDLFSIQRYLQDLRQFNTHLTYIYVADQSLNVYLHPDEEFVGDRFSFEKGDKVYSLVNSLNTQVRVISGQNHPDFLDIKTYIGKFSGKTLYLFTGYSLIDTEKRTKSIVLFIQRSIFLGLISAFIVSFVFSKLIVSPLEKLKVVVDKISTGDFSDRGALPAYGSEIYSISNAVRKLGDALKELNLGQTVQREFIRHGDTSKEVISHAISFTPSRQISGDLVKYHVDKNGDFFLIGGDVSGKGLQAGMYLIFLTGLLVSELDSGDGPLQVSEKLNFHLSRHSEGLGMYATFLIFKYSLSEKTLRYTPCGSPPFLKYSSEVDQWEAHSTTGEPLGLFEDISIDEYKLPFLKNDLILFFTDGLLDSKGPGGECITIQTLVSFLNGGKFTDPDVVVSEVKELLNRYLGGNDVADDVALFCFRKNFD